jgi:tetratricopeptide (TPR) repeat protein
MSLIALASRQTEAAVKMATAAVAAAPALVVAWVTLGRALKAAGQMEDAEYAYNQAIQLDGPSPLARVGLGELKLSTSRPEGAAHEFELALRRRPASLTANMGLGNALAFIGKYEEALAFYQRALALHPRLPEAEFASGFILARLGRLAEAEARYRAALSKRPDFAAAWVNLGCLNREQGREAAAETALSRALALQPNLISGWINLAILKRERGRFRQAEDCLRKAFEINPDQVETLIAWCRFCAAQSDLPGARAWLQWALARSPSNEEAHNMEGILLHAEGRFDEAVAAFERAEALGSRVAASNRGNSLLELGRNEEALRAHETAVEHDPVNAGAKYNLALTRLRLGDWRRGWSGYEARWHFREVHRTPRRFSVPRWQGEPLAGRRILLHAEQGLGDTIQFCRYAILVAERGGVPILQVQKPVEHLLRSLPVVRAGRAEVSLLDAALPPLDLECPLMSLPAVFATTVETVPWPGAYLAAETESAAEKLRQFPSVGSGRRIGLAWAGNPRYKADRSRSTRLRTLLPLLRAVRATWISLQKGEPATQLSALPRDLSVLDASSGDRDLSETAATIATLDLVIATDTSIAHLAGAMGKPVWILLPHFADWRWMQNSGTSPWYPTARLFRQTTPGDWRGVIDRVISLLN